ncbi:NAD(P)/FAD-dependent oxidoreductase [Coleofasciculus sp. F4-SAH-05]|uniref:NAD(P)/FAD-dependent oxidoreductase n=1 Tax=Coleofasciculus sp. F4-SAH-05 TaxID=3069525 RepID=UPI003304CDFC
MSVRIVVIGGGAAGFFGAIASASAHPHTQVILLEASKTPLTKVRISGGGRCNVTHACFDPALLVQAYPRGGKALRSAFTRFQPKDTIAWFEEQGVHLKTEADGRMFPVTDTSQTIVDCLIHTAISAGVQIRTATPVKSIRFTSGFQVQLKTGEIIECDRVLLATGSNPLGYRFAQDLGHSIQPPVPSLFTFTISDPRLQDLAGISVNDVRLKLPEAEKNVKEQTGPLLITHWGLSGPAVLKLSAWGTRFFYDCHYQTPLVINWLPQYTQDYLRQLLLSVKSQLPHRHISTSCPIPIPKRLWQSLISYVGIDSNKRWAELSKKALNQLVQELNQGRYVIQGKGVFKEEFVTCGGISLKEVNFKTMESRCCRGLYFAGEILDIDGITGGFNFQNAWTTAWLAGQAMGKR